MLNKFYSCCTFLFFLFTNTIIGAPTFQLPVQLQEQLKTVNDTQKIKLINNYAQELYFKEFELSKVILDSTLSWSLKIHFFSGEANAKKILGQIHYLKGEYELAAKSYINSLSLYEKLNDKSGQADVYNEMAILKRKHDDVEGAEVYLLKALKLNIEIKNSKGLATTYNNLGIVYETYGKLDSAMVSYKKALAIYTNLNDSTGMGYSYDYIGLIHAYINEFDASLLNLKRALQIRENLHDKQSMAYSYVNLGEVSLATNKQNDAINYFNKCLDIAVEMKNSNLISYVYKKLSEIAAQKNNFKEAYNFQTKYTLLNDSLFNLKRTEQIADIQARYESEKKEKENVLLLKNNKEKELHISQQRVQLSILVGIMFALILTAGLFYNWNKLRQQQILNDEIQSQERLRLKSIIDSQEGERQRIAAELHDGLGQVLSAARINLASIDDKNLKDPKVDQVLELIDRSCRELREISHNMMPSSLINTGLVPAIRELALRLNSSELLQMEVVEDGITERIKHEIEINLYRIIQELITNIVKYANATEIQIQIIKENEVLTMMLEDNGVGFDKEILLSSTGNGWYNIQSRTRLLNGQIEIDSQIGNGTVVTLSIPV